MYSNWHPSGQDPQRSAYSYHPEAKREVENRGHPYAHMPTSSSNYYTPPHAQPFPTQSPTLSPHQPYSTHDPRLTAQQTNQTLTALASARRISPEYIMLGPQGLLTQSHDHPGHRGYYDPQQPQRHTKRGEPSDRPYNLGSAQSPNTSASPPHSSGTSHKTSDGHACGYCGKAFGRPSALKIHLAIHTGEKAFVCPEAGCHRSFSVRSNLSRHIRNVHQIWPDGSQGDLDSGEDGEEHRTG